MISPNNSGTATGFGAKGETWYITALYNDTTGALSAGMPLFLDVTDAAQNNTMFSQTAVGSASPNFNLPTSGKVVLATNANVGASPIFVGVFQPFNTSALPANGAQIRVQVYGYALVSAVAVASGSAVTVGANLTYSTSQTSAVVGAVAAKTSLGTVEATRTAVTSGASIIAVPGSGSTVALINAFIYPC